MHDTPPEIERLRAAAHRRPDDLVPVEEAEDAVWDVITRMNEEPAPLDDAIQAVRDTEAKYQALVDAAGAARFFAGCSRQPCPTCDPSGEGTEIAGEVYGRLDAALNALGTDRIAD